jgi:hypothetical protein
MSKNLVRISQDGYIKSSNTVQENLTQEDIDLLLEDYNEVVDIIELKPTLEVKYFTTIKNKKLFRMGGTIIKVDFDKKYIVLTNGKITWSVQLNNKNNFYRKMTLNEVKEFYENELNNMELNINKYKQIIEKLKEENNKYKKLIK